MTPTSMVQVAEDSVDVWVTDIKSCSYRGPGTSFNQFRRFSACIV